MRLTSAESNILEISDHCVPQAGNSIKRPKLRGLKWSLFGNFNHRFVNRMLLHNINIYFSSAKGQIWLVNHESIVPARIHNQMIGQNNFITFVHQEKESNYNISGILPKPPTIFCTYLYNNEYFHEKNKALFQANFPKHCTDLQFFFFTYFGDPQLLVHNWLWWGPSAHTLLTKLREFTIKVISDQK